MINEIYYPKELNDNVTELILTLVHNCSVIDNAPIMHVMDCVDSDRVHPQFSDIEKFILDMVKLKNTKNKLKKQNNSLFKYLFRKSFFKYLLRK